MFKQRISTHNTFKMYKNLMRVNNDQKNVTGSIVDADIRFEDVKVKSWSK